MTHPIDDLSKLINDICLIIRNTPDELIDANINGVIACASKQHQRVIRIALCYMLTCNTQEGDFKKAINIAMRSPPDFRETLLEQLKDLSTYDMPDEHIQELSDYTQDKLGEGDYTTKIQAIASLFPGKAINAYTTLTVLHEEKEKYIER